MRRASGIFRARAFVVLGLTLAAGWTTAAHAVLVSPTHVYELNGSYDDSLGGPALGPIGGVLTTTDYQFSQGQGLKLSSAISPEHYSIEVRFSLDSTTSWRKLVDFKNRAADEGLYNYNTALQFYSEATGPSGALASGKLTHLLLTRDSVSKAVTAYINGVQQLTFVDDNGVGAFTGADNVIHFVIDDNLTGTENGSGLVDYIRIYGQPLSADDAMELYAITVPEPATWALTLLGASTAAIAIRRRRGSC